LAVLIWWLRPAAPIFADLNDSGERDSRFGSAAEELEGVEVLAFRWRRGDDASCNNPFRATQPQVMGVSLAVAEWFDDPEHPKFGWAGVDSTEEAVQRNPWRALFSTNARDARNFGSANEPVAVVIDKNTAMWGLQIYSVGQEFSLDYDGVGSIRFKVVAFLDNTILQGRLMMSDVDFRRLFPTEEGDRYFLMRTGAGEDNVHREQVRSLFEDRLGDVGFATRRSEEVLSELLAVQNTYLSTFQSLGALGLLLGTFGLATVQLRSVLERRGELALMQAIGFRRGRLMRLIALENACFC
jgi:putative ABC transport system permease protein